jgi:hypothetical protein
MANSFRTVPTELLEYAEAAVTFFKNRGYTVKIEEMKSEYPNRPTLVCKRQQTTLFIEVHSTFPSRRLMDWILYCGSCSGDTQVALVIPKGTNLKPKEMDILLKQKIGLYLASSEGLVENNPSTDLALKISLPDMTTLSKKVRALLGSVYEKFERGQWRDGFKDACQVLEAQARRYLKDGIRTGRITIIDSKGNPKNPPNKAIDKMPIGPLAITFANIQAPNRVDTMIAKTLSRINPDRVAITHKNERKQTEKSLRRNVGGHMWVIIQAISEVGK